MRSQRLWQRRTSPRHGSYQPQLDGLRAVSVIAVLLFHAGFSWMTGGYLGVSVFFTLSGFLITRLLIAEHGRSGRIDLGTFYSRRARRLLPASVVCLVGVCVFAAFGAFDGVANLRRDVLGAGLQVANWTALAGHGGYAEQLAAEAGTRSPLTHYWSLAIEEQFYWLWPVVMVGVLRWARNDGDQRRRTAWAIGGLTVAFAAAAPAIAAIWGSRAAYWATPARVAEILAGALLAAMITAFPALLRPRRTLLVLGAVCGTAIAVLFVLTPSSGGFAYAGALPLFALLSAGLLWSLQVQGPLERVLSIGPLAWLGRISYGVYLYHWPVYVLLDERRTGIDGRPLLFAVRAGVTLAVATISFYAIEQPVRVGATVRPARVAQLGAVATIAIAACAFVLVPAPPDDYYATAAPSGGTLAPGQTVAPLATRPTAAPATTTIPSASSAASTDVPPATIPPTTEARPLVPVRPVRIMVIGDSTAEATANGLISWAAEHPDLATVSLSAERGCGFMPGGEVREVDRWRPVDDRCDRWVVAGIGEAVDGFQPDVAMLMTTSWDVLDRRWPGTGDLTPFDPIYRDHLDLAMQSITDDLLARGVADVAWIRHPIAYPYWLPMIAQTDPARHQPLYDEMQRLADERPGQVSVLDLAGWVEARGWAQDQEVRPDGVHWTPAASAQIADEWLGQALVEVAVAPDAP